MSSEIGVKLRRELNPRKSWGGLKYFPKDYLMFEAKHFPCFEHDAEVDTDSGQWKYNVTFRGDERVYTFWEEEFPKEVRRYLPLLEYVGEFKAMDGLVEPPEAAPYLNEVKSEDEQSSVKGLLRELHRKFTSSCSH